MVRCEVPGSEKLRRLVPQPGASAVQNHAMQFYEGEPTLVSRVAQYVLEGIRAGEPVLLLCAEGHEQLLEGALLGAGLAVEQARRTKLYRVLSANHILDCVLDEGWPVGERLARLIRFETEQSDALPGHTVRLYSELTSLLWGSGRSQAAIEVERLWGEIAHDLSLKLYCGCPMSLFEQDSPAAFEELCRLHDDVIPGESYTDSGAEQSRLAARLQHASKSLGHMLGRQSEALLDCESRYRRLFESSSDGLYRLGTDLRLRSVNPALARICGYESKHELFEASRLLDVPLYLEPGERDELLLRALSSPGEWVSAELEILRADGQRVWIEEKIVAVPRIRRPGSTAGEACGGFEEAIELFEGSVRAISGDVQGGGAVKERSRKPSVTRQAPKVVRHAWVM
jgi:PAS domain S-box-containing protein